MIIQRNYESVLLVHQNWLQTVSSKPLLLLFINGNGVIYTRYILSEIAFKKRMCEHYTVLVGYANRAVRKVSNVSH
ncbi:hypothetical protein CXF95_19080 [Paraglaciecola sp. MB-3u-78]|nr:hypothetical protein CXF95_19080 [Paraglaciecola sp. MB-3u-78]